MSLSDAYYRNSRKLQSGIRARMCGGLQTTRANLLHGAPRPSWAFPFGLLDPKLEGLFLSRFLQRKRLAGTRQRLWRNCEPFGVAGERECPLCTNETDDFPLQLMIGVGCDGEPRLTAGERELH